MFIRNLILLLVIGFSVNSYGRGAGRDYSPRKPNEKVTWIGEVSDSPESHNTKHDHKLTFTRQDNGKKYDVKDSAELKKLHHETGKNYLMEIQAEIHPWFFSEYLTVSSFKVLKETSESIPHKEIQETSNNPTMGE